MKHMLVWKGIPQMVNWKNYLTNVEECLSCNVSCKKNNIIKAYTVFTIMSKECMHIDKH